MPPASTAKAASKHRTNSAAPLRKATARSRTTNQPALLPGVDGRSLVARRFFDICQAVIADQAGATECSETRLQLIRRFSACSVLAEQMETAMARGEAIDIAAHAQLSSTLVRLASRIGIDRRSKAVLPSVAQYLEHAEHA